LRFQTGIGASSCLWQLKEDFPPEAFQLSTSARAIIV